MPIYEYECAKCGVIEVMQKITDDPLKRCPNCRRKVKRLISLNNFHLKGSGWYATDYGGKNGGNGANGKAHQESKSTDDAKKKTSTDEKSAKTAKSSKSEASTGA